MNTARTPSMSGMIARTLCAGVVILPLLGQTPAGKFEPPRLKDGHPNLQGLWKLSGGFGPPDATSKGSPPLSKIEYLREALAKKQQLLASGRAEDLVAQCVTASVPRDTLEPPYPMMIVQDGSYFVILHEFAHDVRIIPVDGSRHPKDYSALGGDSRGRWEGDTFVVDVTSFSKGIRWLHMGGDFVDENEHAVEHYTLINPDTILYEVTLDDPSVFAKPWNAKVNLLRQPKNDQIIEGACREGERDLDHYVVTDSAKPQ